MLISWLFFMYIYCIGLGIYRSPKNVIPQKIIYIFWRTNITFADCIIPTSSLKFLSSKYFRGNYNPVFSDVIKVFVARSLWCTISNHMTKIHQELTSAQYALKTSGIFLAGNGLSAIGRNIACAILSKYDF